MKGNRSKSTIVQASVKKMGSFFYHSSFLDMNAVLIQLPTLIPAVKCFGGFGFGPFYTKGSVSFVGNTHKKPNRNPG